MNDFMNKWRNQAVPSCGGITGQCVSLSQQWAQANGVGGCPVFPVQYAYQMAGTRPDAFDWVPNTPEGVPPAGAVMVLDSRWGGGAGHTGICTGRADTNTYDMFQQNDPYNSGAHVKTYNYNGCLGWLVFKSAAPVPQKDNEGIVQGDHVNVRSEPTTQSTNPWYYDDQEKITLLERTQGETVVGKWGATNWWYRTDKGWVSDGFVQTTKDPANVPDYVKPQEPPKPVYSTKPSKGLWVLDVSAHQGDVDWSKKKVDAVIVKAGHTGVSYGGKQPQNADPKYADNIKSCGIPFGSYWYGYPGLFAKDEAKAFAETVDKSGSLWLDLEEQDDNAVQWAKDFIEETERLTGKPCHLYTYFDYAKNHPGLADIFPGTNRKLWLAHYGVPANGEIPATPLGYAVMHQYTSGGKLDGINTNVDLNVFQGTVEDFKKLGDTLHTEPIPPDEPQNNPPPPPPSVPAESEPPIIKLILKIIEWLKQLIRRK